MPVAIRGVAVLFSTFFLVFTIVTLYRGDYVAAEVLAAATVLAWLPPLFTGFSLQYDDMVVVYVEPVVNSYVLAKKRRRVEIVKIANCQVSDRPSPKEYGWQYRSKNPLELQDSTGRSLLTIEVDNFNRDDLNDFISQLPIAESARSYV